MANSQLLDAPPKLFEDLPSILDANKCLFVLVSNETTVRGVRRKDTACYEVSAGGTNVHVALERRLGNRAMWIAVIPNRKSIWWRDRPSEQLAEHVASILIDNGAYEPV